MLVLSGSLSTMEPVHDILDFMPSVRCAVSSVPLMLTKAKNKWKIDEGSGQIEASVHEGLTHISLAPFFWT